MGFSVRSLGFGGKDKGLGARVWSLESGFGGQGQGLGVERLGFRVWVECLGGLGFWGLGVGGVSGQALGGIGLRWLLIPIQLYIIMMSKSSGADLLLEVCVLLVWHPVRL